MLIVLPTSAVKPLPSGEVVQSNNLTLGGLLCRSSLLSVSFP